MKLIVLIAAGLFVSAGIGFSAATITPWRHTAPSYFCKGYQGAAWCRLRGTAYEVFVTRGQIAIYFQGSAIFGCTGRYADPYDDCNDFR
jgi:hypothetical protein